MSDYEQAVIAANDAKAGRSVPGWKLWALWLVTLLAFALVRKYGELGWVVPTIAGAWSGVFYVLLVQYKRRSIR